MTVTGGTATSVAPTSWEVFCSPLECIFSLFTLPLNLQALFYFTSLQNSAPGKQDKNVTCIMTCIFRYISNIFMQSLRLTLTHGAMAALDS